MITTDIQQAAHVLNSDGVVAIPTETVYGLAANAFSEQAVKKIFALKGRPLFNPLIMHIRSVDVLDTVAIDIPETARQLAAACWPGPLTLILKKQVHIPGVVTAGMDTVAVRVPNHPVTLALLQQLDFPVAAPSANPFGSISPTSAAHVHHYFKDTLDVILDGGDCAMGVESTIIGFDGQQAVLYRHGSIPVERIEQITGKLSIAVHSDNKPSAPGMLSRHYAPKTDTYLTNRVADLMRSFEGKKIGLLLFNEAIPENPNYVQEVLSTSGDLNEAAKNLYAAMHRLDQANLDVIIAERFPEEGLGLTLNDRLQRAIRK